jgi:hypothetical protein
MEKVQQWQRVKEIVGTALERGPQERSAFLDEACAQDGELRAEVESLLAAHAEAGALSENPGGTTVAHAGGEPQASGRIARCDDWVSAGWARSRWRRTSRTTFAIGLS